MRWTMVGIGAILIGIGLYFFPFGEDLVFKGILDYSGGDYWTARMYQYAIFGSMIMLGFLMLRYKTKFKEFIPHPFIILGVFVIMAILLWGI